MLNATLQNLGTKPSTSELTEGFVFWHTGDDTAYVYTGLPSPNNWLDLGKIYTHPDYTDAVNQAATALNGAHVVDKITIENGHITTVTTRELTPGNIGAALANHTHDFSDVIGVTPNTILANNTASTGPAKAITPSQLLTMLSIAYGNLAHLQAGTDGQNRTWSAEDISEFVNDTVNALSTVSNLSLGTRTGTAMTINNSNGTNVTLPQASTSYAGLFSALDKVKLNGIEEDANNYTHPAHTTVNQVATALTGLEVLSRLTVATNGHVTRAEKRTITAAELAAVIFDDSSNTSTTRGWTASKIYEEIGNAIDQAQTGGLQYRGEYNPATNTPDITVSSVLTGYTYVASNNGTFAGHTIETGDMLIAKVDNPGSTGSNWQVVNKNIEDTPSATTTIKGIIEIATNTEAFAGSDSSRAIVPSSLKYVLGRLLGSYVTAIGDGASTHFDVTHNLDSENVHVRIIRASSNVIVEMQVAITDPDNVAVDCNIAPSSGEYEVLVSKVDSY